MRIASWNLNNAVGDRARRLGALLAATEVDLLLAQEAHPDGVEALREEAGLEWVCSVAAGWPDLLEARGRGGARGSGPRSVAIAGRGESLRSASSFPEMPLPEKVLLGWLSLEGADTLVVSYHAPTGAQHRTIKADQSVRLAMWLTSLGDVPVILGGDFNGPVESDPPDASGIRTGWDTGHPELNGRPGDDVLIGGDPIHPLRDTLRVWLADRPDELDRIRSLRPDGPLATSHVVRPSGRAVRYDAIWASRHFAVADVRYLYEEALEAGSDHALVIADLTPEPGAWSAR